MLEEDVELGRENGRGDDSRRVGEAGGTSEKGVEAVVCIAVLTWEDADNPVVEEAVTPERLSLWEEDADDITIVVEEDFMVLGGMTELVESGEVLTSLSNWK